MRLDSEFNLTLVHGSLQLFQILFCQRMMRVDLQRALEMRLRLSELSQFRQRPSQIRFCIGIVWLLLQRRTKLLRRAFKIVLRSHQVAQIVVRIEIIGTYFQPAFK